MRGSSPPRSVATFAGGAIGIAQWRCGSVVRADARSRRTRGSSPYHAPVHPVRNRLCDWVGLLAPVLFVGLFNCEGALRPGYDPVRSYVSALSLGPRGWIQIANFPATGASMFAFVACARPRETISPWGARLLGAIALGILLSGPFVMDPMGTPPEATSAHGTVHQILGACVFTLMPISCFVVATALGLAFEPGRPSLVRSSRRRSWP